MSNVIIDTDPGVDDALAIAFASASRLNISGITTVFGNVSARQSTKNALQILKLLGKDIPVYQGSAVPLVGEATRSSSHGNNGLGNLVVKPTARKARLGAGAFMAKQLQNSDAPIDIIAIGPSTNIAKLIQQDPELAMKIRQIIIMGGAIDEPGNITEFAEFNAYNDPLALKIVLESSVKTVLIPADVCRKVIFKLDDLSAIRSPKMEDAMKQLTSAYISYYQNDKTFGLFNGGVMYDLLAVAYLLDPSLFTTINGSVDVCIEPGDRYGQTTVSQGGKGIVARDVDADRLTKLFIQTINSNDTI